MEAFAKLDFDTISSGAYLERKELHWRLNFLLFSFIELHKQDDWSIIWNPALAGILTDENNDYFSRS